MGRGVALILIGGLAAGCSSGVARFTDATFASSTNQQSVVNDTYTPPATDATTTASVDAGRVTRSSLPAPGPVATAATQPIKRGVETRTAAAGQVIDPLSSAVERGGAEVKSTANSARMAAADPAGWSSAGGSMVTAKEGETVFNLSRRYGVPANVLMKTNGLDDSGTLKAGQKIIIPTYIYSDRAPVSAPDNNPRVAAAKSSRGNTTDASLQAPEAKLAAKPAQKSSGGVYTVAEGDSMSRIARQHGVSVAALKAANGGSDTVRIGQQVKIPSAGGTAVAAAKQTKVDATETFSVAKPATKLAPAAPASAAQPVAYTPPVKTKAIASVEEEADDQAPSGTGIDRMRWPAKGRVAKSRDGIDIQVPEGTPVKAAENGVVIYAGDGLKDFGNTVLVRHANGLVTVYGHAGQVNVKRGQTVKRGEQIATSGMSGQTDTPKLHFEVRKDSSPVDPTTYLQ